MASKNTKMKLQNRSKSGEVDEFKSQSKKFRKDNEVTDKVKSLQVAEKEKMTSKTTKKREIWKVVNKMEPNYANQSPNRMNDEVTDKVKLSQVDEREKMTVNIARKKRETWNSSCGTDIGVLEQMGDNIGNRQQDFNNMALKNHVSARQNIHTETSFGDQIFNEKGSEGTGDNSTNIEKGSKVAEDQKMEVEEEIQIIKQKLVQPLATVDIKQENSIDEEEIQIVYEDLVPRPTLSNIKQENSLNDEEEIQIMYENLVPRPTLSNIKQEQPSYQPNLDQNVPKNGQIGPRKDDGAIPSIDQKIKSQNLTVKIDCGEVTVTDGGRTVEMKMTGGSISGQAHDVISVVKTLAQVVRDL